MHASTSSAQFALTFGLHKSSSNLHLQRHRGASSHSLLRQHSQGGDGPELADTPEEKEGEEIIDDIREASDVPVISIEEPTIDTPVRSPDDTSCDSVSFFLNTDDSHLKTEAESDSGVSVNDVLLDVPFNTAHESETKTTSAEHVNASENTALLDGEDLLKENDDSLLNHEEPRVIEEDSCLNFSGCPLFSSIFSRHKLRCSPCGYYSDSNDDEKVFQTIPSNHSMQNAVSAATGHEGESVDRDRDSTEDILESPYSNKQPLTSAVKELLARNTSVKSDLQTQTHIPLMCVNTHDLANAPQNIHGQQSQIVQDPLNPTEKLPEWLKSASKDATCLCSRKTVPNQSASIHSGNKYTCIESVPSDEHNKTSEACAGPICNDTFHDQTRSSPDNMMDISGHGGCHYDAKTCAITFEPNCDVRLTIKSPLHDINCDNVSAKYGNQCLPSSKETRNSCCNPPNLKNTQEGLTTHNASTFPHILVTCQNGSCLTNGNTVPTVSFDNDIHPKEGTCINTPSSISPESTTHQTSDKNAKPKCDTKDVNSDQKRQLENGGVHHVDQARNGIVSELPGGVL